MRYNTSEKDRYERFISEYAQSLVDKHYNEVIKIHYNVIHKQTIQNWAVKNIIHYHREIIYYIEYFKPSTSDDFMELLYLFLTKLSLQI